MKVVSKMEKKLEWPCTIVMGDVNANMGSLSFRYNFIPFLHCPIYLVLIDYVFKQLNLVLVQRCIYTVQTYVQLFWWNSTILQITQLLLHRN